MRDKISGEDLDVRLWALVLRWRAKSQALQPKHAAGLSAALSMAADELAQSLEAGRVLH